MAKITPEKPASKRSKRSTAEPSRQKRSKSALILKSGFVGTKVSGPVQFACTNFDKLLIFHKDGTYKVINIPEKQYFEKAVWVGVADKKTVINVVYKNKETSQSGPNGLSSISSSSTKSTSISMKTVNFCLSPPIPTQPLSFTLPQKLISAFLSKNSP